MSHIRTIQESHKQGKNPGLNTINKMYAEAPLHEKLVHVLSETKIERLNSKEKKTEALKLRKQMI